MLTYSFHIGVTEEIKSIRFKVFCDEQGFSKEIEMDEHDKDATFVLIKINDLPVGTGRIFKENGSTFHIGRVAILKEYRRQGIGTKILKLLEEVAKNSHATNITIGAQHDKRYFYETCGYSEINNSIYYEEGCPHVLMNKSFLNKCVS